MKQLAFIREIYAFHCENFAFIKLVIYSESFAFIREIFIYLAMKISSIGFRIILRTTITIMREIYYICKKKKKVNSRNVLKIGSSSNFNLRLAKLPHMYILYGVGFGSRSYRIWWFLSKQSGLYYIVVSVRLLHMGWVMRLAPRKVHFIWKKYSAFNLI